MKTWIKWTAAGALTLATLCAATLAVGSIAADRKMRRLVPLRVQPVAYLDDAVSIARGQYLYKSRGCVECHGADGGGRVFIEDGGLRARAPNITPAPGSATAGYAAEDWVRTIRHGIKPSGQPVFIMPSEDYARMTDADLAALVAWLRHMPAAAGEGAQIQVPPLVKTLYAAGVVQDAAEKIDHTQTPPAPVAEGPTPEHGAYLANMCIGCHGPGLSGGTIPGAPPSWPAASNLTPGTGSAMKTYLTPEQFAQMLRTGKRPDGSTVSTVMPFTALKELNDTDARALYAYLTTLPPRTAGGR